VFLMAMQVELPLVLFPLDYPLFRQQMLAFCRFPTTALPRRGARLEQSC